MIYFLKFTDAFLHHFYFACKLVYFSFQILYIWFYNFSCFFFIVFIYLQISFLFVYYETSVMNIFLYLTTQSYSSWLKSFCANSSLWIITGLLFADYHFSWDWITNCCLFLHQVILDFNLDDVNSISWKLFLLHISPKSSYFCFDRQCGWNKISSSISGQLKPQFNFCIFILFIYF